ncbi:hypothetical protein RFI_15169 [Reticulomyxa filosa]|uniref:Uncharacterized protein n=1 Tax=Reticulomyxa filosa TaxID=46433 RepID=X6N6Y7_RETFI|nr:hypothetical protein RFI_15169 [Reticulomyxa filosa]|eukprot:ETO22035.1 hypothetical protein RFI_15169 [Reticulomyxa filosa]
MPAKSKNSSRPPKEEAGKTKSSSSKKPAEKKVKKPDKDSKKKKEKKPKKTKGKMSPRGKKGKKIASPVASPGSPPLSLELAPALDTSLEDEDEQGGEMKLDTIRSGVGIMGGGGGGTTRSNISIRGGGGDIVSESAMTIDISGMNATEMETFVKSYRLKDDMDYLRANPHLVNEAEMAPHSIEVQNFAIITSLFFRKLPSAVKTSIWTHVVSSRDYVHNKMVSHRTTKSVDQITRILSHLGILFDVVSSYFFFFLQTLKMKKNIYITYIYI